MGDEIGDHDQRASPDRICGMYYALPEPRRRAVVCADGVWSYDVAAADWEGVEDAARLYDEFPTCDPTTAFPDRPELRADYERFCHEAAPRPRAVARPH